MASKCAGRGVPFGYDPQKERFVWLSSVPLERFGERCGLVCPSCGVLVWSPSRLAFRCNSPLVHRSSELLE